MTADRQQAVLFAQRYLDNTPWIGREPSLHLHLRHSRRCVVHQRAGCLLHCDRRRVRGIAPVTSREHAHALDYLLYARPILGERTVVASHVRPRQYSQRDGAIGWRTAALESGPAHPERRICPRCPSCRDECRGPDLLLPSLLPPDEIHPAEGGASGTCAMFCNRADVWSSSFSGERRNRPRHAYAA